MTYPEKFRDLAVEYAICNSVKESAQEHGVSTASIRLWAKTRGVKFIGRPGRRRHPKLRDVDVAPYKNTTSRHRYYLLHVYQYTCYDCGLKDNTGDSLQQHIDYNKFPVEVLILCTVCHGKRERHDKNIKN